MNRIVTFLFGLFFTTLLFAQTSKVDYDNDSRWFWGINAGTTWSTTDVTKKHDWGWGLTLGKSFNYNYGKAFSFDIRGRYLTGHWVGHNYDTTDFTYTNTALSTGATDYKTNYGFSVLNYETTVQRASLELVIHANSLRAKTGWDVFVFGGIGYTWYKTYGNLINDKTDSIYNYAALQPVSETTVNDLLDNSYETELDGTSGGKYSGNWMPSLGFGIGYQVGPRFSIGLEHKTTFTLLDNFDGSINPDGKRENDLYHYTSAYLRFQIRDHAGTNDDNSLDNVNNYDQTQNKVPPVVDFRSPSSSGTTVSSPTYVIRGEIKNVVSANNVTFRQNGNNIAAFSFNPSTLQFESTVTLVAGQNTFELTGTNDYGSDMEQTIIIYNRELQNPPVVTYINPSSSPTTVQSPTYALSATVFNVTQQSQVTMTVNGQAFAGFNFNPANNVVTANLNLVVGTNIITTTGTNQYGTDSESTVLVYSPVQTVQPPVVTYTNPSSSPTSVQNAAYALSATVLNVTQQSQVTMTVNGQSFTNFSFNPSNHVVTANLNLVVGTNIVTTTGTNQYGTDSESTTLIYNPIQTEQPPVVYYVDPNVTPYTTSQGTFTINADVLNVAGAQNITFKQNGTVNQNFTYNAVTDDFQSGVVLNAGQNVFEIIATNTAGSAQATTIIIYERQAPKPPIVTITNPANNPQEVTSAFFTFGATVLNVTQASQITVKLNGQNVPNFTYTASNSGVTANLNLVVGSNVIIVTGTNNDGTDSKQTVIIYRVPVTIQPPVVTFSAPNTDPFTTEQPNYTVIASVLNVANQSGVNVNVNGTNVTNFTFNAANSLVSLPITLIEGANVITITGTNTAGTDSEPQTIIYRKPAPIQPPVVSFINPAVNPTTVFNQTFDVQARVRYVMGSQQITLRINGQVSNTFNYSVSSEIMTFTTGLVPGANTIEITGTNAAGQDVESTTIIYREPNPTLPPVVTITNPIANPHTVNMASAPIAATVLNVDGAQNIQVTVNGANFGGFTFNTVTKQLALVMSLVQGSNSIVITATNSAGTASDTRTIVYRKEVVIQPPLVTFILPSTPATVVNTAGYTMKAHVNNVDQESQIVVSQNGQAVSSNLWNFDAATKDVTFNTNLNVGNNVFTVTGTNTAGTHSATTNIIYNIPIVICDKPVITFTAPASGGTIVQNSNYTIIVSFQFITNVNQVNLLVNGVLQSPGTLVSGVYTKAITLVDGQNSLEVVATNACGETKALSTINYQSIVAPCNPPVVQRVDPLPQTLVVETETITVKASVSNIDNVNQLSLVVNGTAVPFNYDNASHFVTATVSLAVGENTIVVTGTNTCGKGRTDWKITRQVCNAPTITVTSSTVADGAMTFSQAFGLEAAITGVSSNSNITVTHNGQNIGFVYIPQTGVLTLDRALQLGVSTFVIKATNNCGQNSLTFTVTRRQDPNAVPPVIQITTPATTPYPTQQAGMTVQATASHVTAANQISVTLNGAQTNFEFNAANGTLSFNANFAVGANVIVATAVTPFGTSSDTKTVIYTQPVVVSPPVITLVNPARCPAAYPAGNITISGSVTNISDQNQVVILYNNANTNFTSTIVGNTLTFSFNVTILTTTVNIPLVITATNAGGTDTQSCLISVSGSSTSTEGQGNGGQIGGGGTIGHGSDSLNGGANGGGRRNGGAETPSEKKPAGTINTPAKTPTPVRRPE